MDRRRYFKPELRQLFYDALMFLAAMIDIRLFTAMHFSFALYVCDET